MESASIEARAFKSSCFVSEAPVNANPQEDHFFLSSAAAADDFSVDQFFEFHGLSEDEEEDEEDKKSSSLHDRVHEGSSFSVIDFCGSFSVADGLSIPAEDMEELELWSHLMDGTFHHDIFACPATYPDVIPAPNRVHFEPKSRPVLTRPRTKHPRSISGSWATFSLIESQYSEPDRVQLTGPGLSGSRKTGMKRKSPATEDGDSAYGPAQQRKCTHCQVQKTPQWRTGPLGPKTLCNACGVRFNMGRLFPEYRPACSPTFSSEIHSNNHRKVAEMRKRKIFGPTGSGLAPEIQNC